PQNSCVAFGGKRKSTLVSQAPGRTTPNEMKRARALPPGPNPFCKQPALLARNLVVDALDVEVRAEDLAIVEMVAAFAFDGLSALYHDRTLERMQLARDNGGFGVLRHLLHVVGHVSVGGHHDHFRL